MKSDYKMCVEPKNKIPKEFGLMWIEALRSGNFNQTSEILYDCGAFENNSMCCLGVALYKCNVGLEFLCESMPAEVFNRYIISTEITKNIPEFLFEPWYCDISLPDYSNAMNIVTLLAKMNDSGKYNFNDLADYIENNLLEKE